MQKKLVVVGISIFLSGLLCIQNAFAGGYDNMGIGASAMMRASAFIGVAEDGSAVYYNPAALAFLKKDQWQLEGYAWITTLGFEYTASYTGQGSIHSKTNTDVKDLAVIPGGFATRTYDKWAFGFGFYIPYAGGGADFSNFQQTNSDFIGYAGFPATTAAVGYRVNDAFSIGAAFSLYSGIMEATNSFSYNPAGPNITPYKNEFSETVAGYGGHVSIYYQPSQTWSFGLTLRSEIPIKMDGTEEIAGGELQSDVEFTLPYTADFGLAFYPTHQLSFNVMASRRYYASMDKISFAVSGDIPTHYNDSWNFGLGLKYKINEDLVFGSGIKLLEGTTDDQHLSPANTDIDVVISSIGVNYKNFDIGFLVTLSPKRNYNNQSFDSEHYTLLLGMKF